MGEPCPPHNVTWPRWMAQGGCVEAPTADFYPEGRVDQQQLARVRAICWDCPVRRDCLSWALRHEKYGIWGGFTEQERTSLIRTTCKRCRWSADPITLAMRPAGGLCADCRARKPQHPQPGGRAVRNRSALGGLTDLEPPDDQEWFRRQVVAAKADQAQRRGVA